MGRTPTDRSLEDVAYTRPTVPTEWTAFRSCTLPSIPSIWSDLDRPAELSLLPDTLRTSPKLAQIVHWSLQRPVPANADLSSSLVNAGDQRTGFGPELSPPPLFDDRAESSCTISDTRSKRSSLGRAVPRLRGSKRDLIVTTVCKITSLKEKREGDAIVSKILKEGSPVVEKPRTGECTSCFDDLPIASLVNLPCTHSYCNACLSTLILTALQNESAFPPKCCLSEIPAKTIIGALDKKQQQLYKEKAAEYSITANRRWYCPNVKCLKWIPPNKLDYSRMSAQKCSHCQAKICGMCRGAAHDRQIDCPQDFGLEATIHVAELEGWRRCHRCRTMIERSTGCRHITCKCGAEFCYVCAAPWRTCNCTEVDEANRQALLRRQREDRDAADQAEADEVARAIAAVEALLRSEADVRRQREEEEERERQREEAELARLEQIRLEEETARKREREEAERQLRDILRLSIQEDAEKLVSNLKELLHAQHIALDDRQGAEEERLIAALDKDGEILAKNAEMLSANMQKNVNTRIDQLKVKHVQEAQELAQKQEEQEDELFLQIQTHLKAKPNREQREKKLTEAMKREQGNETTQLNKKHERDLQALESLAMMEIEGLERSRDLRMKKAKKEFDAEMSQLLKTVAIDRMWFGVIWERRLEMIEEHGRMMVCDLEAGREPLGLTEEHAKTIMPLPVRTQRAVVTLDNQQHQRHEADSMQHTPVELEAPMTIPRKPVLFDMEATEPSSMAGSSTVTSVWNEIVNFCEDGAHSAKDGSATTRKGSNSSFVTAPSHTFEGQAYNDFSRNPWAWALEPLAQPQISDAERSRRFEETRAKVVTQMPDEVRSAIMADYSVSPPSTRMARHLTPPSPTANKVSPPDQATEARPMPMPHNGNAYLSVKNGECSHPVYDLSELLPGHSHMTALPTPPDSPLMPWSFPSHVLSANLSSAYPEHPAHASRSESRLNLRVPSRLSIGGNSIDTTLTVTPIEQISANSSPVDASLRQASKVKPKRLSVPPTTNGVYTDSFLDTSSAKNKAPVGVTGIEREPIHLPNNMLSPMGPKESQKRSFWPFRRKTYTGEEIKERMKRAVGDAMAA